MHNRHRTDEARAHYQAQETAIKERKPIFELRAQEGQTIVLQGVSELIVHDPREQRIEAMPQREHPLWGIARATLPSLVTGYVGITQGRYSRDIAREQYDFLGRVIEGATPSVTVGGDYISGQQHIGDNVGRDYITGHVGDAIGRDRFGRDQIGRDQVIGDRNLNRGRQDSPGPIDDHSGDCREGTDCSVTPPPAPPDPDPDE